MAARVWLHASGPCAVQSCAAHPRQRRVRDLSWRCRAADGCRAERRSDDGLLCELPSTEERAERLPHVPLLAQERVRVMMNNFTTEDTEVNIGIEPPRPQRPLR